MNTLQRVLHHPFFSKTIHWKLLIFLLLFLNVKLAFKLAGIAFIYIAQPDFRFGFRWKQSRLPLFYPLAMGIAVFNAIVFSLFLLPNYPFSLLTGLSFWCLCILAVHQIKLIVEKSDGAIIYHTLVVFFLLNAFLSALEYISIVFETGALNPFRYQGDYQKYFISTGDYIKGISFDTSTTNAVINAFGIIFFLWKRSWIMLLVCTCTLLLTGSNLVNLIVFVLLFFLLIFKSDRTQKSLIVVCFAMLVIFISKVSPQNSQYMTEVYEKAVHKQKERTKPTQPINLRETANEFLTAEQRKDKTALLYLDSMNVVIAEKRKALQAKTGDFSFASFKEKPVIPEPSIHSAPFQNRDDTNSVRRELLDFMATQRNAVEKTAYHSSLPGKAQSFLQTANYFTQHPAYLFTGLGIGNFSSKLAFKTTALQFAGGYPKRYSYIHPDFLSNHLSLYLHFFSQRAKLHSITNSPNAVYDQLLAEYGLIGLAAFLFFYIGYFIRQHRNLSYGIPLLFLLLSFFFIDYWFEQLSVVVLFELLLFLNYKELKTAA